MRRRSRFGRRSGISSLIGAIFFVLIVFLVFTSTVLIFETFSNYATTFKQVNSQDIENKATSVSLSSFAFGGVVTNSTSETVQPSLNTKGESLRPIQNMNFTSSMTGWTFSRGYELSLHNGTLVNTPQNVLPGLEVFSLTVSNNDHTGPEYPLGTYVTSVEISVNPAFELPAALQQSPAGWNAPSTTATTITWTASTCTGGIPNTGANSLTFEWTAVAPAIVGAFSHTVTVTWQDNEGGGVCSVVKDKGLSPITTYVVTSQPGGAYTAHIFAVPGGTVPGGAFGGFDATSADIGSASGPGSVYLTYGPSLDDKPLTSGQQLTVQMNFTSDFSLSSVLPLASSCCVLSLGYSLDGLTSNSSQILMNAYLTDLSATCGGPGTSIPYKQIVNNTVVDELNGQNVSKTGWIFQNVKFTPGVYTCHTPNIEQIAGQLQPGLYQLTISVTATLFGSNPPSLNYPASMLMHFDDVGLALQELGTASYCADTASSSGAPCVPTSCSPGPSCDLPVETSTVLPQQVQSMRVSAQVADLTPGVETTAYAYIEDIGASPFSPSWVELGQVTFTSSATISATIPASSASYYLDENSNTQCTTKPVTGDICLRIYAIQQSSVSPLAVNVSFSVQTWNETAGALYVQNNGTSPVHLVSLFVSGPGVDYSNTNLVNVWVSPGETMWVPVGAQSKSFLPSFAWSTGQTYVATFDTSTGLVVSGTFISP